MTVERRPVLFMWSTLNMWHSTSRVSLCVFSQKETHKGPGNWVRPWGAHWPQVTCRLINMPQSVTTQIWLLSHCWWDLFSHTGNCNLGWGLDYTKLSLLTSRDPGKSLKIQTHPFFYDFSTNKCILGIRIQTPYSFLTANFLTCAFHVIFSTLTKLINVDKIMLFCFLFFLTNWKTLCDCAIGAPVMLTNPSSVKDNTIDVGVASPGATHFFLVRWCFPGWPINLTPFGTDTFTWTYEARREENTNQSRLISPDSLQWHHICSASFILRALSPSAESKGRIFQSHGKFSMLPD